MGKTLKSAVVFRCSINEWYIFSVNTVQKELLNTGLCLSHSFCRRSTRGSPVIEAQVLEFNIIKRIHLFAFEVYCYE